MNTVFQAASNTHTAAKGALSNPPILIIPFSSEIKMSSQLSTPTIGVPSQEQPSAKITSFSVASLPSLQAEPTVAGMLGLLSSQSSPAGTPSLSLSVRPPPFGVPSQVQPSAKITSLLVLAFPSLQVEPTVAGILGSLSLQSSPAGMPSLSLSVIPPPPFPVLYTASSSSFGVGAVPLPGVLSASVPPALDTCPYTVYGAVPIV